VTSASEHPPLPLRSGPGSLARQITWQTIRERLIRGVLFACAGVSVVTTVAIILVLLSEAVVGVPPHKAFFQQVSVREFLTETRWTPDFEGEGQQHYGILPLFAGTMLITVTSGLVGLPIGLLAAIYLSEYAAPRTRAMLKPVLELLAGVPTIVYGYFALKFITPYVLRPVFQDWLGLNVDTFNALSGGIVVGIMIMPMVCSLSEDVLRAVPQSLREAGYALGSTRFDVSVRIVVPSALSGILASFILALSRGIGETMAVAIASGQQAQLTANPLSQIQTMTAFIVNVMKGDVPPGSTLETSIYAVALVLFAITLVLNIISQMILRRYREVYQ
jgi:phosphate transport system permease protein